MGDPPDLELARGQSRVNTWTDAWFNFRGWRERRRALLREEQERALAREAARIRAAFAAAEKGPGTIEVRWGLPADAAGIAELLELNGMPRWVAFEERFIVAEKDGKVLGALRYRTESTRLLLGLLVVDPWAGEERLARALYRGARELASEMGAKEIRARSELCSDHPREAGYRRWRGDWHLDVTRPGMIGERLPEVRWRRVFRSFGIAAVALVGVPRKRG